MSRSRQTVSVFEAAVLGLWIGLATGYGELAVKAFRRYVRDLFLFQSADAPWLTPLATALVFGAMTALVAAILRAAKRSPSTDTIVGVGVALAALSLLFLVPPLHKGAATVMAIGFGVTAYRAQLTGRPWFGRARRVTFGLFATTTLVTAAVLSLGRVWAARQEGRGLAPPRSGAPNVLLIILDTVRSLNLSVYGYSRPTKHKLATRAAEGTRFDQAWSPAPWTLPSHAAMFTGKDVLSLSTDWYVALDDSTLTLAEALRDRGWRTGGFVANLPYTSREVGLARGFSHYEDHPFTVASILTNVGLIRTITQNRPLREALNWHHPFLRKTAREVSTSFLRWVDQAPNRPFFAFLNYYDAHRPYYPPASYQRRFLPPGVEPQPEARRRPNDAPAWRPEQLVGSVASYDAAIAYLDDELELLFQDLARRGMLENTLVILTSDHGEEFAEHGMIDHGNSLYRPSLAVPLLMWWPGHVPGGRVVTDAVTTRDIPATVVDLLGLAAEAPFPGRSLARTWAGADSAGEPIFAEVRRAPRLPPWYPSSRGNTVSVLEGNRRVIKNGDGVIEVYDLATDPDERTDRSKDPTLASWIEAALARIDSATAGRRGTR